MNIKTSYVLKIALTLSLAGHYYPDLPVLAAILIDL